MRVIAGKYRGKILKSPKSANIRPTGDKVKQALFTKLQFFILDTTVLDLFCGSGALGIEAISNGAKRVYFVDKDIKSINLTKQNLEGIIEDYKILNCDYSVALNTIKEQLDLILVDPPYASGVYEDVLNEIHNKNLLSDEGIVVCEHPKEMQIKTNKFIMFDKKTYGTVALSFYRKDV